MHALTTSATAAYPASPAALLQVRTGRSRQALEAVDAYLRWDTTHTAPHVASFRLLPLLSNLAAKLLK